MLLNGRKLSLKKDIDSNQKIQIQQVKHLSNRIFVKYDFFQNYKNLCKKAAKRQGKAPCRLMILFL